MGHEVIADKNGAFIYDNTTERALTPRLTHPVTRTEHTNREFAHQVIETAEAPPGDNKPGFNEYQDAITTVTDELT